MEVANKPSYKEFEAEFKKHHICGYPIIPYELAYDSRCPLCCPEWEQWKDECRELYDKGCTVRRNHYWGVPVDEEEES